MLPLDVLSRLVPWRSGRGAAGGRPAPFGEAADEPDYYRVLGVHPSASQEAIAAAYQRLAARYHPRAGSSSWHARRLQEVNAAYEVLSHPSRRADYDRRRRARATPVGLAAQPVLHVDPPSLDFVAVEPGRPVSLLLVVHNPGGGLLEGWAGTPVPWLRVEPGTVRCTERQALHVILDGLGPEDKTTDVSVLLVTNGGSVEVPVRVHRVTEPTLPAQKVRARALRREGEFALPGVEHPVDARQRRGVTAEMLALVCAVVAACLVLALLAASLTVRLPRPDDVPGLKPERRVVGYVPQPTLPPPVEAITPTPLPVEVLREQYGATTVAISNPRPRQGEDVFVTLNLRRLNFPAEGRDAFLRVHLPDGVRRWPESGVYRTNHEGLALMRLNVGNAPPGEAVRVEVVVMAEGQELVWETSFTPQRAR